MAAIGSGPGRERVVADVRERLPLQLVEILEPDVQLAQLGVGGLELALVLGRELGRLDQPHHARDERGEGRGEPSGHGGVEREGRAVWGGAMEPRAGHVRGQRVLAAERCREVDGADERREGEQRSVDPGESRLHHDVWSLKVGAAGRSSTVKESVSSRRT